MRRREFITGFASAAASPLAAWAQQQALPVIGFLSGLSQTSLRSQDPIIRQGLNEQGYVEGRNVEILHRWAEGRYDQLPALAADLVRRRVAVIVAAGLCAGGKVRDGDDSDRICSRRRPG
jgi:putative ABC transport system substrate-binding protein